MITTGQLIASAEIQRAAIEDQVKQDEITEFEECNELLKECMCRTMLQRLNVLRDKEGDEELRREIPIIGKAEAKDKKVAELQQQKNMWEQLRASNYRGTKGIAMQAKWQRAPKREMQN